MHQVMNLATGLTDEEQGSIADAAKALKMLISKPYLLLMKQMFLSPLAPFHMMALSLKVRNNIIISHTVYHIPYI